MLNRNYMVAMPDGKIHSMDINAEITVLALKHLIEDIFFIPVKFQNLLVGDRYLVEDDAISVSYTHLTLPTSDLV